MQAGEELFADWMEQQKQQILSGDDRQKGNDTTVTPISFAPSAVQTGSGAGAGVVEGVVFDGLGGIQEEAGFGELAVHGPGEEEALELVAAEGAEDGALTFGFDALGDDGHAKGVGHGDDVLDDSAVGGAIWGAV